MKLQKLLRKSQLITDNEINVILLSDESNNKEMVSSIKLSADMRDITALTFKLSPLSESEAKQLLNHRFAQLAYSPQVEHQDALLKQLLFCQGVPEKILQLATELNSGKLENNKASWFKTRFPAILLMLVLVAIASSLAFYLYPLLTKKTDEVDIIIETEVVLLEELPLQESDLESVSAASTTEALAGQWSNHKKNVDDNQLSVGEADHHNRVIISESQLVKITTADELNTSADIEQVLVKRATPVESLEVKPPNEPKAPIVTAIEPIIAETQSQAIATIAAEEIIQVQTQPAVTLATDDNVEIEAQSGAEISELKESVEVQVLQTKPLNKTVLFTENATLVAINANKYTLQLSAMSTNKSLQEFILKHQLPRQNVYLYQTVRNQKPLYVVIYGQFESRQAANRVAANLPTTLKTLDSWVKKIFIRTSGSTAK